LSTLLCWNSLALSLSPQPDSNEGLSLPRLPSSQKLQISGSKTDGALPCMLKRTSLEEEVISLKYLK
jgi:hypothetical protein